MRPQDSQIQRCDAVSVLMGAQRTVRPGSDTVPGMTDAQDRLVLPRYPRPEGLHPPLDSPEYRSTSLRHPKEPLVVVPQTLTEVTGPLLGPGRLGELDH